MENISSEYVKISGIIRKGKHRKIPSFVFYKTTEDSKI